MTATADIAPVTNPVPDLTVEEWLDQRAVRWTYEPAVSVAAIDRPAGLANQARFVALDPEVVDRYHAAIDNGETMPPVVLHVIARKRQQSQLVPIGGNHRLAAHAAAKTPTVAAYLVECEPETARILTYEDNHRHGLPPTEAERVAQALHLADIGMNVGDAARTVGVSIGKVQRGQQARAATRRAATLGVVGFEALGSTTQWRLDALRSDPVFEAAAQLAIDADLPTPDVYRLVTEANKARSEADALALVGLEREAAQAKVEAKATGRDHKRGPIPPRVQFLRAATQLVMVDPATVAAGCADDRQRDELARRCLEVAKRAKQVADAARSAKA